MIKAKITVFDDETGKVYDEDKIIQPYKDEILIGPTECCYDVEECEFRFDFRRII
jgi:hypothetical protein